MTAVGTKPRLEAGRSMSALPGTSDINLFRYCECVIDFDAEIPNVLSILVCSRKS
jgi:hypothetical protein